MLKKIKINPNGFEQGDSFHPLLFTPSRPTPSPLPLGATYIRHCIIFIFGRTSVTLGNSPSRLLRLAPAVSPVLGPSFFISRFPHTPKTSGDTQSFMCLLRRKVFTPRLWNCLKAPFSVLVGNFRFARGYQTGRLPPWPHQTHPELVKLSVVNRSRHELKSRKFCHVWSSVTETLGLQFREPRFESGDIMPKCEQVRSLCGEQVHFHEWVAGYR